jgi:hypothetical protein
VHVTDHSLENWIEFAYDFVLVVPGDVLDAGEGASEGRFLVDHFQAMQHCIPIFFEIL